uniref:Uncharacterized protein n=1 Tax=Nelumbo nucifera TaxID=4432 RepID=A0A822ZW94_NELNU|nr:TPA_asm: hypothetical protein HUJ06_004428 [Nelumbo nucifera]
MHEFSLAEDDGQVGNKFQQWVLCRIKENKRKGDDTEERQGGGIMAGDYRNFNDAFASSIPLLEQGNYHQEETILQDQRGADNTTNAVLWPKGDEEMREAEEMIKHRNDDISRNSVATVPVFPVNDEEAEMNELLEMIETNHSYSPEVHTVQPSGGIKEQQQQLPQPQQEDSAVLMLQHTYSDGIFYQQQQPLLPQPQPMEITLQASQQANNHVNLRYDVIHVM